MSVQMPSVGAGALGAVVLMERDVLRFVHREVRGQIAMAPGPGPCQREGHSAINSGGIMKRLHIGLMIASWILAAMAVGCTNSAAYVSGESGAEEHKPGDAESDSGGLSDEHIEGFEREIQAQYRQLKIHYRDYDKTRRAPESAVAGDHREHRLHRKLKRRHRTLARLHEDRMWLVDDEEQASKERQLAKAHRSAFKWHDERFEDDGQGVAPQDAKLEVLRGQFEPVDIDSPVDDATEAGHR